MTRCAGILGRGGTILGTSGAQPFRTPDGIDRVREAIAVHRLDGFIAIGGEGTMGACAAMPDVPVVGVPKTIDNDIGGTDHSIGFQSAVQIATELIDRLYSTAESHQRVMVCEVMGRSAGWIGLEAGIAGAADVILLPEHPFDIELVARRVKQRMSRSVGSRSSSSPRARRRCPARWRFPTTRSTRTAGLAWAASAASSPRELADAQRCRVADHGARPRAAGRVARGLRPRARHPPGRSRRSTRRRVAGWGTMVGMHGQAIVTTPLAEVAATPRTVPEDRWRVPQVSAIDEPASEVPQAGSAFRRLHPCGIGILTGGGDVPGLNASIKAVVNRAACEGHEVVGIRRGWGGLLDTDPDDLESVAANSLALDPGVVRTIDRTGGTFLHTSRTNPAKVQSARTSRRSWRRAAPTTDLATTPRTPCA